MLDAKSKDHACVMHLCYMKKNYRFAKKPKRLPILFYSQVLEDLLPCAVISSRLQE
jgi:hypothetical protein